jgi:hypothetical protein
MLNSRVFFIFIQSDIFGNKRYGESFEKMDPKEGGFYLTKKVISAESGFFFKSIRIPIGTLFII